MRDDEGPAKNQLLRRTKKRQARHNGPLLVFRSQEQKSIFQLGRFSSSFAEITDQKSSEAGVHRAEPRFRLVIYTAHPQKSSPKCGLLRLSVRLCLFYSLDTELLRAGALENWRERKYIITGHL